MGLILWAVPLAAIVLTALTRSSRLHHAASITASAVLLAGAAYVTARVLDAGSYELAGGVFYVDAVSVLILDIVLLIGLMTAIYSVGYLEEERAHGKLDERRMKRYYLLMHSFIFTMVFALTVRNIGAMWVAIEATTLASAFLVGFGNDKPALEGAWKYVIICSVGIAVAMLGVIFLYISASGTLSGVAGLDWTALFANAGSLNGDVLRFAFIFILIGFGTKAGLAPMHTWLPDAHSQAPSPVSALLSGVLLNSAMYGIIRCVAIVNKRLESTGFTSGLMIAVGLLSMLAAALFILTQKDYKRLLAYSSIEHMGVISLSIGLFTPASLFAGFFHMINHSLTKSLLFLSSGSMLQKYGTREIGRVKGLLKTLPVTGTVFLLGLFAIGGMPPFSIFASEFSAVAAAFKAGQHIVGGAVVLCLALAFAGIVYSMFKMFHGRQEPGDPGVLEGETNIAGAAVAVVMLAAIVAMGIAMPDALKRLIESAAATVLGGNA